VSTPSSTPCQSCQCLSITVRWASMLTSTITPILNKSMGTCAKRASTKNTLAITLLFSTLLATTAHSTHTNSQVTILPLIMLPILPLILPHILPHIQLPIMTPILQLIPLPIPPPMAMINMRPVTKVSVL